MPDPFERVPIGTTSVAVTRLGFGAAEMGGLYDVVDDEVAMAAAKAAWELGVMASSATGRGLSPGRTWAPLWPAE